MVVSNNLAFKYTTSHHYKEEYVPEPDAGYFQEAMVVNYPSADVPFTRIVEYKHTPNQPEAARTGEVKGTLIAKVSWREEPNSTHSTHEL